MAVELSFCVITTEQRPLLRYCLDAVARERATLDVPTEVLVLDNASADGSAEAARQHRVGAEVVAVPERRRRGENAATLLERATGRYCLLLANAPELEPGAAVALYGALEEDPQAGAAGALLVRPDGDRLPSAWRHSRLPVRAAGDETRRVDVVQCAAVLLRRAAAEAAGGLDGDPGASEHGAELAFCRRLGRAGWRVLHVPAARAVQHGPADEESAAGGPLADLGGRLRRLLLEP